LIPQDLPVCKVGSAESFVCHQQTSLVYHEANYDWRSTSSRKGSLHTPGQAYISAALVSAGWRGKKAETLEQAARREAAEELGASLGQLGLRGVYTNFYEHKNDHVVVFSCSDFSLTGASDREIERFGFFSVDNLPENVSPGSRRRIQEYVNGSDRPIVGMW